MPPRKRPPASDALYFVRREVLDDVLTVLVPDPADRSFVLRCLLDEGPLHHRGSNYLILALLGKLLKATPGGDGPGRKSIEVPMNLPPHLEDEVEDGSFPIQLPLGSLAQLLENDERALEAAVDCLTDGPPQHCLANVVTVAMLDRVLERLKAL